MTRRNEDASILKPFDIFHSMGMLLEQGSQTSVLTLSRSQHAGYYSHRELECARQLLPHLRNIQAIQKTVAIRDCDASSASHAAWALSADGQICGRNARTATLTINPGCLIGERAGMLWPSLQQDRVALQAEIGAVLNGLRLSGRVPIRDKAGTPRYIAHVRHCRREAFLTWLLTDAPAALVVLQPLACDPATLAPTLLQLYGLSPAECRVAVKLLELESIQLVAAALNRSEETVRSQVKAVFTKTGTHTQAQLLRLLYALGQH